MKKIISLFSLILSMTSAQALELKKLESSDRADANFCGDINSAALYEIVSLETEERDAYSPERFVLTAKGLEKIRAVLPLADSNSKGLVVTASYRNAKSMLADALGAPEGEVLGSCQPVAILDWFGLNSNSQTSESGYYVFGELSSNGVWADEFRHHVVIDLKRMRLATFLIW